MKKLSLLAVSICAITLASCGSGQKLSFKNSDEVIKSYKAVTANMTEAERQEFRRNMFLVFLTEGKDAKFEHLQTAIEYDRNTVELTGPDATPLAKELALKAGAFLDGKTVAEVNEIGGKLKAQAVDEKIAALNEKTAEIDASIAKLKSDKDEWTVRNSQAKAQEEKLIKETAQYNPKVIPGKIGKNWSSLSFQGKVSVKSPHTDPIYDFRYNFNLEHNGYVARYRNILARLSRDISAAPFNLTLDPLSFVNDAGQKLASDYVMPKELSAYSYSFRPVWVRTSGKANGWTEHEYKLSDEHSKALYNLPKALENCDRAIKGAQDLREKFNAQVTHLESGEFDELRSVYGRYPESCL